MNSPSHPEEDSVLTKNAQQSERDFLQRRSYKRDILSHQRELWQAGKPAPVEDLLRDWPEDPDVDADVASVLLEDLLQRRMLGESVSLDEYSRRFPSHKESLSGLWSRNEIFRSLGASKSIPERTLRFPEVGDEVFGFRLRSELGRGSFARVFLAEQIHLAGRPVAVKLSAIEGTEPQTLAQMQHTHIMPIHSVQEDERAGLRAVCMPYFGGASLSRVLQQLWAESKRPRHGSEFAAALEKVSSPLPGPAAQHPGEFALAEVRSESYVRAACWVIARLAEGLQHAHQRGVLHRDIKPANILLGGDGQPMLLDFNLSQNAQNNPVEATLGGTIAYMSPEHLRALIAQSSTLARAVDNRSDIFSLGMVLYEMLTGARPFEQSGSYSVAPLQLQAMLADRSKAAPSLRAARPDVPWGVESIVRKCLTPDPAQRYQQAEHLAEDLQRFLEHRPLRFAPELSVKERLAKWARRHPGLTTGSWITAVAAVLLVTAGSALFAARGALAGTQQELSGAQARERKIAFDAGYVKALCLVHTTIDRHDHLKQGVLACEQTLSLYGILEESVWQEPEEWLWLANSERKRLAEDTRELLLLLAGGRVRLAGDQKSAARQALNLVAMAEAVGSLGPSRASLQDRARYLRVLGETTQANETARLAEQTSVTSAREHYLHATSLARSGTRRGYEAAITSLDKAIALDPRHYWSWTQRGICHAETGDLLLAARDFSHCTGLWPEFAWGYFNLGCVLDQSGSKREAVAAYTAALQRDSRLLEAAGNRGLALLQLKHYSQALADFDQVVYSRTDDARWQSGRGMALEALHRHSEADEAFRKAHVNLKELSSDARLRALWAYGFAVSSRLPTQAKRAFEKALLEDSSCAQALYGLAMLEVNAGHEEQAIRLFTRAVEVAPQFTDARRYRAVLLARSAALGRASEDINWCLQAEPRSGATLYAAACVAALAARHHPSPEANHQALSLLGRAFDAGESPERARTDPDLSVLQDLPPFRQMLRRPSAQKVGLD